MTTADILRQLKMALETLSLGPDDQLEYVRQLGTDVDELALEFDDIGGTRGKLLFEGSMRLDQSDAIAAVDRQLLSMTRAGAARWTEEAVRNGEDWAELRRLAENALVRLRS